MLEQYGARGTYYVSGGGCGAPSPSGPLATVDQLRGLHARGHSSDAIPIRISRWPASARTSLRPISRTIATSCRRSTAGSRFEISRIPMATMAFPRSARWRADRFLSWPSLIPERTARLRTSSCSSWPPENASSDRRGFDHRRKLRRIAQADLNSHAVTDEPTGPGVAPIGSHLPREAGSRPPPVTIAQARAHAGRRCKVAGWIMSSIGLVTST